MMGANLYTAEGAYVVSVEIPPFETGYPPIVQWGARTFLRIGGRELGEYVETFCYMALVEIRDARADMRAGDDA